MFERIPCCPTCGKVLPCVLHDQAFSDRLLRGSADRPPPEPPPPAFRWSCGAISKVLHITGQRFIVVTEGGEVHLLDPAVGKAGLRPIIRSGGPVLEVVELPDERVLVIRSSGRIEQLPLSGETVWPPTPEPRAPEEDEEVPELPSV